ncbi:MAG: hypothetical protein ACTTIT_05785, partial [Treponema sp.]
KKFFNIFSSTRIEEKMAKLEVTKNADGFFIRKGEKYSLSITATEILLSEITGFYVSRELINLS